MDLKLKDKKLFLELFQNSKQSNRQIAKKIGISKETVSNRINFFKENNYIKDFSCKINYNKLGFQEYNLFVRLKNISENKINSIINYLENYKNTIWIGKAFGKYDFKISIITKKENINEIIGEISQKFSSQIDTIDYLFVTDKYKANSSSFLQNLIQIKPEKKIKKKFKNSKYNIEIIDKKIIYELSQNPKESIIQISSKLNLTTDIVKYRIKKLEENNIITGYSIVFNGNKFNKIWCLILFNFDIENLENFKNYLKKQELLSSYTETLGVWNFNVTFFANNIEELYSNLNKIRNKFSQNIKNFEILIFFEFYKYPKVPKCILLE